jgi:predicted amidophosphoribosyltransferase
MSYGTFTLPTVTGSRPGARASLLDALFPMCCPGCGTPGVAVCGRCAAGAAPAPPLAPPPGVDSWASPFAYEGVVREVVARLKYRDERGRVRWLTGALVAEAGELLGDVRGPLAVTWAPTSVAHRRARGFDQAELLARAVARTLRVPCRPLLRRLGGPPQTGLPARDRRVGPRLVAAPAAARALRGLGAVLVVDDVATTGATLAAAAAALRVAGASTVFALTAARTPAPGAGPARTG